MKLNLDGGRKVVVAEEQKAPTVNPSEAALAREIRLKGTTKSNYPFDSLRTGQAVLLVPDPLGAVVKPDEGHDDPDAISVQDSQRQHIAYIPRAHAGVLSRFKKLNPKMTMTARIESVGCGDKGNYGIVITTIFDNLESEHVG